jgi:Ion transport protein
MMVVDATDDIFLDDALHHRSSRHNKTKVHRLSSRYSTSSDMHSNILSDDMVSSEFLASESQTFRKRHKRSLQMHHSPFNRLRLLCGKIVNNDIIQISMIVLIIINAIVMGIATFDFVTDDPTMAELFQTIDRGFLAIYTLEMFIQLLYFGWHIVRDAWLLFDLTIIIISWALELNDEIESQFQIIRAIRIFRALQLITRIDVLRHLVAALGEVIPRLTAITMFLMLFFYTFAVLFTELFNDLELNDSYFSTLDASMFTCFQMMTFNWAAIARQVMAQRSWGWIPFLIFVMISGYMAYNLIIAVICDAVSNIDKVARERDAKAQGIRLETPEMELTYAKQRSEALCERIDYILEAQKELHVMIEILAGELYRLKVKGRRQRKKNG